MKKNTYRIFWLVLCFIGLIFLTSCSSGGSPAPSNAKAIDTFWINDSCGIIDETAKTIAVTLPYGTDVTALIAIFYTTGISVKVNSTEQICGVTMNNFTNPVIYRVTAADNSSVDYTVTVTVAPCNAKAITSFSLLGSNGVINEAAKTIAVTVPYGTDTTSLIAIFSATGISVNVNSMEQVSGTTINNFINPVIYTVTAGDNSTVNYTVTVTVALNTAKAITSYSILGVNGNINEAAKTISVILPYGTSLTGRVATFATTGVSVKIGSFIQVSGTSVNNFTNPVIYTVKAADNTTVNYTVTVTCEAASNNANLANLTISSGTLSPDFSSSVTSYSVDVGNAVNSMTVTPTKQDTNSVIAVKINSGGFFSAVVSGQPSGSLALNVGSNTITIRVTAQDDSFKLYTITVTRAASSNANLSDLQVAWGSNTLTLTPVFSKNVLIYTVVGNLPGSAGYLRITATLEDSTAVMKYSTNGSAYYAYSPSTYYYLNPGTNVFSFKVTSQDGTTIQTYTINAYKNRKALTPVFSNTAGEHFIGSTTITITSDEGATIYYTTDNSTPNESSLSILSGESLLVTDSWHIKAYAVVPGFEEVSNIASTFLYRYLTAPTGFTVALTSKSSISATWNPVASATRYAINSSTYLTATSYTKNNLTPGEYSYYVTTYEPYRSEGSGTIRIFIGDIGSYATTPNGWSIGNTTGEAFVTLKWDAVSDVSGYNIYRQPFSGGQWTLVSTINSGSATITTAPLPTDGVTYSYGVSCFKFQNNNREYYESNIDSFGAGFHYVP